MEEIFSIFVVRYNREFTAEKKQEFLLALRDNPESVTSSVRELLYEWQCYVQYGSVIFFDFNGDPVRIVRRLKEHFYYEILTLPAPVVAT